jgi:lysyl-tRNA synthetase class 1
MPISPTLRAAALESRAWPFEEARKILKRVEKSGQKQVLFAQGLLIDV